MAGTRRLQSVGIKTQTKKMTLAQKNLSEMQMVKLEMQGKYDATEQRWNKNRTKMKQNHQEHTRIVGQKGSHGMQSKYSKR